MSTAYENNTEQYEENRNANYPFAVAVQFRDNSKPYSFGSYRSDIYKGDKVVVETAQGLELGVCEADAISVEKYNLHMPQKPVIRMATKRDVQDYEDNIEYEKEAFEICESEIADLGLNMNLLSAQYTLDRNKILFIYLADQRVDFRELLKHLGAQLHCRIELRQIGERDKAKMVGGIGMCGMECCCRRYKTKFDVISINMAKDQMLALNTEKLSGMCGKLMCCLKYEDEDYKDVIQGMPKLGSQVEYEGEIYRITNMNVMTEEAKLENFETVIFISFAELREKAIARKGVVMQRKHDGEEKKVIYRGTARKEEAKDEPRHVSMDLPLVSGASRPAERKENRFGNNRRNNNANNNRSNNNRRDNKDNANRRTFHGRRDANKEQPKAETKNVTVRTFGKKKKEA